MCGKNYVWNPSACGWESNKYLRCFPDDLVIIWVEVKDVVATPYDKPTNFNVKKVTYNV